MWTYITCFQIADQNSNGGPKPLRTHAEFNGKSVDNIDDQGRTILHVDNGGPKPLRTHAEFNGKSVDNFDDGGRTILHVAILIPMDSDGKFMSYNIDYQINAVCILVPRL